jgi:hypothetical protein
MYRLYAALSALVIAAMVFWLSVSGAEMLFPLIHAHPPPRWFGPACSLITIFCLIIVGRKMRRTKEEEAIRQ